MEFKGTKGKWKVSHEIFIVDENGKQIGETGQYFINSEDKHNAKLIAAAPDLLQALQKIASNSNDHAMIRIAIKAIEKALK